VHLHHQGSEKNFRRNLQGKFVSEPQAEQESIFRTFFLLGRGDLEVYLVLLDRLLRATIKKGRQLF